MVKRKRKRSASRMEFLQAIRILEETLEGSTRQRIVDTAMESRDLRNALRHLRTGMRFHRFQAGASRLNLAELANQFDRLTRLEGVYVLHAWHHERHEFLREMTPVLLLDYCANIGIAPGFDRSALGILLDHYFLNLIALLAMRAWDEGDPNANLERLSRLLDALQGSWGSGFQFVDNVETVLLLSISQYHPDEPAYDRLLGKVSVLDASHKLMLAGVMAAMLGGHLRWGFQDLYKQDFERLRKDNVIDYPWLLFSQLTLLRRYAALSPQEESELERKKIARDLLNGFTADPEILLRDPPSFLSKYREDCQAFRELFVEHRSSLQQEFCQYDPAEVVYSPLSFRFNFPHNALIAIVITALLHGGIWRASLNTLLQGEVEEDAHLDAPETLARALTLFSARPEKRDTRGAAQVIYDPADGKRAFQRTLDLLEKVPG